MSDLMYWLNVAAIKKEAIVSLLYYVLVVFKYLEQCQYSMIWLFHCRPTNTVGLMLLNNLMHRRPAYLHLATSEV